MRIFDDTTQKEVPHTPLPAWTSVFIDTCPSGGVRRVLVYPRSGEEVYYADVAGIRCLLGWAVNEHELYEGAALVSRGPNSVHSAETLFPEWQGLNAHRLEREPVERAFAVAFQNFCEKPSGSLSPSNLDCLLSPGPTKATPASARDRKVACTVIQWLGSPVGQGFVKDVLAGSR